MSPLILIGILILVAFIIGNAAFANFLRFLLRGGIYFLLILFVIFLLINYGGFFQDILGNFKEFLYHISPNLCDP